MGKTAADFVEAVKSGDFPELEIKEEELVPEQLKMVASLFAVRTNFWMEAGDHDIARRALSLVGSYLADGDEAVQSSILDQWCEAIRFKGSTRKFMGEITPELRQAFISNKQRRR